MLLLYAIILGIGIPSTYTDIRFQKIRNIHLLITLGITSLAYTYLTLTNQLTINWHLFVNLFIGLSLALTLYFTNGWGAGDAKLFTLFCLLLPGQTSPIPFSSIVLFVNTFILALFLLIILSIRDTLHYGLTPLKKICSAQTIFQIMNSFCIIFSLNWLIQKAIYSIFPQATSIFSIITLFVITRIIFWAKKTFHLRFLIIPVVLFGLTARLLSRGLIVSGNEIITQLKTSIVYAFLFQGISSLTITQRQKNQPEAIPFAPVMLLGSLLTQTNMFQWILAFFKNLTH